MKTFYTTINNITPKLEILIEDTAMHIYSWYLSKWHKECSKEKVTSNEVMLGSRIGWGGCLLDYIWMQLMSKTSMLH